MRRFSLVQYVNILFINLNFLAEFRILMEAFNRASEAHCSAISWLAGWLDDKLHCIDTGHAIPRYLRTAWMREIKNK